MAMKNLEKWEGKLKAVLVKVDQHLENQYGDDFPLRTNRLARGEAANPVYDGLFGVEAKFSLGIGRREGPGYTVEIRLATFANVAEETRREITDDAEKVLREELPNAFPGKHLELTRDGLLFRLHGDLDFE